MLYRAIPAAEVVAVLQQGIRGDVPVSCVSRLWDEVGSGDCTFYFGDWQITFFNDNDCIDYCDTAVAPDGRTTGFDAWVTLAEDDDWGLDFMDPIELLPEDDYALLEALLKRAVPKEHQ